mmetsp:Transcript_37185/g.75029  ORF Transcript_37185/g.75029 Transcript_37185/m.75029 type:complete len:143 (+) Transcript_37185:114-542(+)
MLMRNPTRIEFKAEDAQEYIKARERQKRQSPAKDSLFGAAPADGHPQAWLAPAPAVQPSSRRAVGATATAAPALLAPQAAAAPPAPTAVAAPASAPRPAETTAEYQVQVQQLTDMGFAPEQARRALGVVGGDVEAAADWLLS